MVLHSHLSGRWVSSGWVAIGAAVGFVLLIGSTTAAVPVVYPAALLVAAAFAVGPSVTLGGSAGVVIHDLFRGAVSQWTAELAVWMLAFAWLVAWLDTGSTPGAPAWKARTRLLACTVAGVYATATAAWLTRVLGGEPFYTSGVDFLSGLLVVVVGALVGGRLRETVPSPFAVGGSHTPGEASDSGATRPHRFDRRRGAALLGLGAVGVLWLVGAIGLDIFAHDLAQFGSESELRNYAGNLFGTGTALATLGVSVLVGVYRYGDLLVRLSPLLVGSVVLSMRWLVSRSRLGRHRIQPEATDD